MVDASMSLGTPQHLDFLYPLHARHAASDARADRVHATRPARPVVAARGWFSRATELEYSGICFPGCIRARRDRPDLLVASEIRAIGRRQPLRSTLRRLHRARRVRAKLARHSMHTTCFAASRLGARDASCAAGRGGREIQNTRPDSGLIVPMSSEKTNG